MRRATAIPPIQEARFLRCNISPAFYRLHARSVTLLDYREPRTSPGVTRNRYKPVLFCYVLRGHFAFSWCPFLRCNSSDFYDRFDVQPASQDTAAADPALAGLTRILALLIAVLCCRTLTNVVLCCILLLDSGSGGERGGGGGERGGHR